MRVGQVGFSYVGAVFLLGLFIPNIVWALTARPMDYDPSAENRCCGGWSGPGRC